MKIPRVSIILPTKNSIEFLRERLESIHRQTYTDWEVVAVDSDSTDGTYELLRQFAERHDNVSLLNTPPDGIYPNWNRGLEKARGEFVYIATSDDTMSDTLLTETVAALDAHAECDIAQCCLSFIDSASREIEDRWKRTGASLILGDWFLRAHIRHAPIDGYLHCALETMYTSVTQILFRRSVLTSTGPFRADWGNSSDFYWGMKAGFHHSVVHIPKFLATWRQHGAQASVNFGGWLAVAERRLAMIKAAFRDAKPIAAHRAPQGRRLLLPAIREYYQRRYEAAPQGKRLGVALALATREPVAAAQIAGLRLRRRFGSFDAVNAVRTELTRTGMWDSHILPID